MTDNQQATIVEHLTPALSMNLHLQLVGMRSTRVPNCLPKRWGHGGTRPYQVQGFNA
jgi:hypothetical protein